MPARETSQQFDGLEIAPVEILENDHGRRVGRERFEKRAQLENES